MKYILERIKEPSTHAGLAAILAGIGLIAHSEQLSQVAQIVPSVAEKAIHQDYLGAAMVMFGTVAALLKEKK